MPHPRDMAIGRHVFRIRSSLSNLGWPRSQVISDAKNTLPKPSENGFPYGAICISSNAIVWPVGQQNIDANGRRAW